MASPDSWTTIESDPGVFTELVSKMGAQGVEVAELWSCDESSLSALQPIYGLIFLFKWRKEDDFRPHEDTFQQRGVFFAKQVIENACATQAIINILMNISSSQPGFSLGPELSTLKEFTADFPPDVIGLTIGNSDAIRSSHNSFHPHQSIIPDEKDDASGDAFHFIAYMPICDGLYELDGLKPGPVRICDCKHDEWLKYASEEINARIAKYSESEQRFNLMAVIRSRRDVLQERLDRITAELESQEHVENTNASYIADLELQAEETRHALAMEDEKHRQFAEENARRRTDYTPFIFNLLKELAVDGQLKNLVSIAEEKHRERAASTGDFPRSMP